MPDSTTVYLVTSGQYSDYTWRCAFTTEELARGYIDAQPKLLYDDACRSSSAGYDAAIEDLKAQLATKQVANNPQHRERVEVLLADTERIKEYFDHKSQETRNLGFDLWWKRNSSYYDDLRVEELELWEVIPVNDRV